MGDGSMAVIGYSFSMDHKRRTIAHRDERTIMHAAISPDVLAASINPRPKGADQRMPACPTLGCRGVLRSYPSAQASYDAVTGLDHLICDRCGHHGMRAPNGVHLVFQGSDEYVFHYPPALTSLIISISPSLLAPFTWHGFTPAQAVTFMAEWLLLTGRADGHVRFREEKLAWDDCYDYFRRGHHERRG